LLAFAMAFQGSRAIWNPDEGRYTHVALQMLRSGDWLTPRLHPEGAHFSKPPLTYWAIAASVSP
jgi:4-amino-4-deoxy-L-arabinose transferase-like glycosyltransferase